MKDSDLCLGDRDMLAGIGSRKVEDDGSFNDPEYRSARALWDWHLVKRQPVMRGEQRFNILRLTRQGESMLKRLASGES